MNANEALLAAKHRKLLESAVFVIFQSSQMQNPTESARQSH